MKIAFGNLLLNETTVHIHIYSKVDYLKVTMIDIFAGWPKNAKLYPLTLTYMQYNDKINYS